MAPFGRLASVREGAGSERIALASEFRLMLAAAQPALSELVADLRLHANGSAVGSRPGTEAHIAENILQTLVVVAVARRCEIKAADTPGLIDIEFGDEMEAVDFVGRGKWRKKEFDRLRRVIGLSSSARTRADAGSPASADTGANATACAGTTAIGAIVSAAAARARSGRHFGKFRGSHDRDLGLDRRGWRRFDFDWFRRWYGGRRRHDGGWRRRWGGGRNLNELQPFSLIGSAAGTAMSSTTAAGGTRPASALWLLDDRMMHGKGRHEQHNDEHVQHERKHCTRTSVVAGGRQPRRRKPTRLHERRARWSRLRHGWTWRCAHAIG